MPAVTGKGGPRDRSAQYRGRGQASRAAAKKPASEASARGQFQAPAPKGPMRTMSPGEPSRSHGASSLGVASAPHATFIKGRKYLNMIVCLVPGHSGEDVQILPLRHTRYSGSNTQHQLDSTNCSTSDSDKIKRWYRVNAL